MDLMTKQMEIMNLLQEECAEVIQMISKVRRFGLDELHFKLKQSNRASLTEEVGDMLALVDLLIETGVLSEMALQDAKIAKIEKLKIWSTIYA